VVARRGPSRGPPQFGNLHADQPAVRQSQRQRLRAGDRRRVRHARVGGEPRLRRGAVVPPARGELVALLQDAATRQTRTLQARSGDALAATLSVAPAEWSRGMLSDEPPRSPIRESRPHASNCDVSRTRPNLLMSRPLLFGLLPPQQRTSEAAWPRVGCGSLSTGPPHRHRPPPLPWQVSSRHPQGHDDVAAKQGHGSCAVLRRRRPNRPHDVGGHTSVRSALRQLQTSCPRRPNDCS
jgi:hypothetical protein